MDAGDLAGLDLNLLVALGALLRERHVSRAAASLGVSQPAMSRSLARLRDMFDDPLLIRSGGGMEATVRAIALLPELEAVLAGVRELVRPASFDPTEATGSIRIAAPDVVVYMLVPELIRRLAVEAPGLDLEIVRWTPRWRESLEEGAIDLTVGLPAGDEPNLRARPLIESHWACVLRRGHRALRKKWTLERFVALEHALISLTGRGGGPIDAALAKLGHRRRIALRLPYPAIAPLVIAETDLVLTTPRWLARKLAAAHELVIRRPPLEVPPARAPMLWHERSHRDPKHRWFRDLVAAVADGLDRREVAW
jgi:DNA-binding transcriptional LysR family regulator